MSDIAIRKLSPEEIEAFAFPYVWRVRTRLPERFGQFCTVLIRGGSLNSMLVMFTDFEKVVTSRWYIRKRKANG